MHQAIARGTRLPMTEEQQRLAVRHLEWARSLAWPFKEAWPSLRDEWESAACLALVEAAESFDPSRGVPFGAFARERILGGLLDERRRQVPLGYRRTPLMAPRIGALPHWPETIKRFVNTEPDDPIGHEVERDEEVDRWLRRLPPKHALACRRIYLHDGNNLDAARAVGCSPARISTLHREALAMFREARGAPAPRTRTGPARATTRGLARA